LEALYESLPHGTIWLLELEVFAPSEKGNGSSGLGHHTAKFRANAYNVTNAMSIGLEATSRKRKKTQEKDTPTPDGRTVPLGIDIALRDSDVARRNAPPHEAFAGGTR
jgi:hypothetical protein